ncbi:NACHT domain-containing protein [Asanoa siamensis]|uniref:NACHT domain-containing protein n=1 Tax=Asanoa siamensis TaxID=926357 RepID=A0ABQ4CH40_9ACTN|nr:NACHT domain-containing protein [Asanoa siamensis]GIF70604.1 hypothetical protein Asi02nite_01220 [Asanoa siamensis]
MPFSLDTGDQIASMVSAVLAVVAVWLALAARRRSPDADPDALLDQAARRLALRVRQQWDQEAGNRGLLHPEPIAVRWSSTPRPVGAAAAEILGPGAGRAIRLKLAGDVTTVAATWRQLPARQLVIIGAPGSGKTSLAVLLVRQLLADRSVGDPVPVLLNMSAWDPAVHVDVWLARRLVEIYPELSPRRLGPGGAGLLISSGRVVPVLDGLDEIPADLRASALTALTQVVAGDRPLVLTCRAVEFEEIVQATGVPLARAAVVEVEPVTGAQAATYLRAGQIDSERRWAPVTATLAAEPSGALAAALGTPLMVYLARTVYADGRADPRELAAFTDPGAIEEHLLAAYLPTVYGGPPARSDGRRPRPYPPEKAVRWLGVLARHLRDRRASEFAWWRLVDAVPAPGLVVAAVWALWIGLLSTSLVLVVSVAVRVATSDGLATGALIADERWWAVLGVAAGTVFSAGWGALLIKVPLRVRVQPRWLVGAATAGVLGAVLLAWVRDLLWTGPTVTRPAYLLIFGLALGLGLGVVAAAGPSELLSPRQSMRDDRGAALAAGLCSAGGGLVVGAAFNEPWIGAGFGVYLGVSITAYISSWGRYLFALAVLATLGRLPVRLFRFLEDAHARGVLRQVGAEYQFRHLRLQEHLAGQSVAQTSRR